MPEPAPRLPAHDRAGPSLAPLEEGVPQFRPDPELGARAPEKPQFGQACNGCGYCCAMDPCAIAREHIVGSIEGPCPAMEFEAGRFLCGMTRRPGWYMGLPNDWADAILGEMFARALGIGRGCDAEDPGPPAT